MGGTEQLTTAGSSNGTYQEILVEPIECTKDCLAQTVINTGQAIGDTVLFPNVCESTAPKILENVGPY